MKNTLATEVEEKIGNYTAALAASDEIFEWAS